MNLDLEAAKVAQKITKDTNKQDGKSVENLVTKTLGVLQENGVYACMLFLYSYANSFEKISKPVINNLLKITESSGINLPENYESKNNKSEETLEFLTNNVCSDVDTLLLTKQLWEQTLIYARYGAKARED